MAPGCYNGDSKMRKFTISLGQMTPRIGQPKANFAQLRDWATLASQRGSDLVLFPELWSTGGDLPNWERHATPLGVGLFSELAKLASELGLAIGGSMLERNDGRVYNTFALFGTRGEHLAVYRKLHLFALMQEDKWLTAGDTPALLDAPWGRTGLAICYDLRFGELFRHYALAGAELALLPAMWPAARSEHWNILLRARAIENQMFIVAVNVAGRIGTETFGGGSAVIGPWGEAVLSADDRPALLTAEIDLEAIATARQKMPVLTDLRPQAYPL